MPDIREEFEAWIRTQVPEQFHPAALAYSAGNDLYLNPHIQGRYEGWKASRAALRVKLQEQQGTNRSEWLQTWNNGYNTCHERVKEALRQAGIEVMQP